MALGQRAGTPPYLPLCSTRLDKTFAETITPVETNTETKSKYQRYHATLHMFYGLISASLLALVHHIFYTHYDGRNPTGLLSQSTVIRVGTTLSLSVKISLAYTIAVAFIQAQWRGLRQREISINICDDYFNCVTEPLALIRYIWTRRRLRISGLIATAF
jgi:hypothetical protein